MRKIAPPPQRRPVVRQALAAALCIVTTSLVAACDKGDGSGTTTTGDLTDDDDDDGGGTETTTATFWAPTGSGQAYLIDGDTDNSLLHLELSDTIPPRDGEVYVGRISTAGGDAIELGEITVDGSSVVFEAELGLDGLTAGYDRFDAWATTDASTPESGTHLWTGQIDKELRGAYEALLLTSSETVDGEGSLRSISATVETLIAYADETIKNKTEVGMYWMRAEALTNSIDGTENDFNDNGSVETVEGIQPILGDDGLVELVLSHLDTASSSVDPGHPIKDLANYAYDCTQRIEEFAETASSKTAVATVCAAEETCDGLLQDATENLGYALVGYDEDEDGSVDPLDEGTIDCGLLFASQMAYMEVSTP